VFVGIVGFSIQMGLGESVMNENYDLRDYTRSRLQDLSINLDDEVREWVPRLIHSAEELCGEEGRRPLFIMGRILMEEIRDCPPNAYFGHGYEDTHKRLFPMLYHEVWGIFSDSLETDQEMADRLKRCLEDKRLQETIKQHMGKRQQATQSDPS
jgi:hypothetical protein